MHGLADILAAQIDARFRYIVECLEETSQPEELLSERQSQTRDLIQSFQDQNVKFHESTIDRICREQNLKLRDRMSAADLARAIQIAVRGVEDLKLKADFLDDLQRVVRLIVTGAVTEAAAKPRRAKTISARKKPRPRK